MIELLLRIILLKAWPYDASSTEQESTHYRKHGAKISVSNLIVREIAIAYSL